MKLNPIIIETDRLFLKGYTPKDITTIFRNYSKNEIIEILGHRNEEEYLTEKNKEENGYATYNRRFIIFLLVEKISNKIIGRCGLHNWNVDHNRAEIGYNMQEDNFKCKGLMSEAVKSIIEYGFKELKLHRIEALVGSNNIASLKIIEKNHFTKEGFLREHYYIADKYEDSIFFSILHHEYWNKK